jgi:hypothetical protein
MTELHPPKEDICPRCGKANLCLNVIKKDLSTGAMIPPNTVSIQEEPCWCASVNLNSNQRAEASKFGNGLCCLCASCIAEIQAI